MKWIKLFCYLFFTVLIASQSGCGTLPLKGKESAIQSKKRAYTNDSQINTSFTLTMGEREFLKGEKAAASGNRKKAREHFNKAKVFYDQAYISSYIFQRTWTLETYERILTAERKKRQIIEAEIRVCKSLLNNLLAELEGIIAVSVPYESMRNRLKEIYLSYEEKGEKLSVAKQDITPALLEAKKLIETSRKFSKEYKMFRAKYPSVDALKKFNASYTKFNKSVEQGKLLEKMQDN